MRLTVAILVIAGTTGIALQAQSRQPAVAPAPKFDVAAIHPCAPAGRGGGRGTGPARTDPGRLTLDCMTVASLIRQAHAGGRPLLYAPAVEGGPAWVRSDRYSIEATAEGAPSLETMRGAMLQALLEDRFKLKFHQDTRQIPIYALTVAKGGPKLQATREGSCVPAGATPATPDLQRCGMIGRGRGTGPGGPMMLIGETMENFCELLSLPDSSDRPVIDKTGIKGMFDLSISDPMELYAMRRSGPDEPIPDPLDKLRRLAQEFGLNLESTKGPAEYVVIDSIERPSEN